MYLHIQTGVFLSTFQMVLAMTICEICPPSEVEVIIEVLFDIFDTRKSLLALLKLMIEREISQTGQSILAHQIAWTLIASLQRMRRLCSEATRLVLDFCLLLPGPMAIRISETSSTL
jgi:hypothetical protein